MPLRLPVAELDHERCLLPVHTYLSLRLQAEYAYILYNLTGQTMSSLRDLGIEHFKAGNFKEAEQLYTEM
jgi:hypothetical protein